MEDKLITSHTDLSLRIMHLKSEKFRQEEALKHDFQELLYTLNPVSVLKESLHDMAEEKEVQLDLVKVGLNMGANLIIDKVLGKNRSIKGFFSSLIVEKLAASFINKNSSKVLSGIAHVLHPREEE
jgi:hypothetical protein